MHALQVKVWLLIKWQQRVQQFLYNVIDEKFRQQQVCSWFDFFGVPAPLTYYS